MVALPTFAPGIKRRATHLKRNRKRESKGVVVDQQDSSTEREKKKLVITAGPPNPSVRRYRTYSLAKTSSNSPAHLDFLHCVRVQLPSFPFFAKNGQKCDGSSYFVLTTILIVLDRNSRCRLSDPLRPPGMSSSIQL